MDKAETGGAPTQVGDEAAVLVDRVLHALQPVLEGAEGQDDLRHFCLQRLQLPAAPGASDHTVAVQRFSWEATSSTSSTRTFTWGSNRWTRRGSATHGSSSRRRSKRRSFRSNRRRSSRGSSRRRSKRRGGASGAAGGAAGAAGEKQRKEEQQEPLKRQSCVQSPRAEPWLSWLSWFSWFSWLFRVEEFPHRLLQELMSSCSRRSWSRS